MSNEKSMTPDEVLLGTLDDVGGDLVHARREGVTTVVNYDRLVETRTAVAALIARNAELEADNKAIRKRLEYEIGRTRRAEGKHIGETEYGGFTPPSFFDNE